MKEELGFKGNELVELQTMYTVGAVVGMIPFMFIFTYIPMYWTIPAMDILWGLFTLLQYRAHSFGEMAAYRFLVGFFEVRSPRWELFTRCLLTGTLRPLSFQPCIMSLVSYITR